MYYLKVKRRETTMVQNSSVILEILGTLVLEVHCSAAWTSPHHFCSDSAFPRGKEPDSIGILFAVSDVCDVKFYDVGKAADVPQQLLYHFHWRNRVRNACGHTCSSFLNVFGISIPHRVQHSTATSQESVQRGTRSCYCTAGWLH